MDGVNSSEEVDLWINNFCYAIGGVDFVLFFIATMQLVRLLWHTYGESGNCVWKAREVFHLTVVMLMLVRGIFFELTPTLNVPSSHPEHLLYSEIFAFLNLTGDTLFFMAYFMLLLFWVELYQSMNGKVAFFYRYRGTITAVCLLVLTFFFGGFRNFTVCSDSPCCR